MATGIKDNSAVDTYLQRTTDLPSTTAFTMMAWVRIDSAGIKEILGLSNNTSGNNWFGDEYLVVSRFGNNVNLAAYDGTDFWDDTGAANAFIGDSTTWYHIALTIDGGTIRVYFSTDDLSIDASLECEFLSYAFGSTPTFLLLGVEPGLVIQNCKTWDRVLTVTQIRTERNQLAIADSTSIYLDTPLEIGGVVDITDQSVENHDWAIGFGSIVIATAPDLVYPSPPALNAPTNVVPTLTIANTQITVTWTDNNGGTTNQTIERKPASGFLWTVLGQSGVGVNSYIDNGTFYIGETYQYRVRSFSGVDQSPYSAIGELLISGNLQTTCCLGIVFRTSVVYEPAPAPSIGNPSIIFSVVGTPYNFGFSCAEQFGAQFSPGPPFTIVSSFQKGRLVYRGDDVNESIELTMPWSGNDPMQGFSTSSPNPRANWPWHRAEFRVKTSSYDVSTGTYAQDGAIELRLDTGVVYTQTNIYIKVKPLVGFNAIRVETGPLADADSFFILSSYTYPTYSGVEEVPSSPDLLVYFNFNDGLLPSGWLLDDWLTPPPPPLVGPVFNLVSGLDRTGGISRFGADPAIHPGSPPLDYHPYGSIRNDSILLIPSASGVGTLIVIKETLPNNDATEFDITVGGGLTPASIQLSNGESQGYINVTPGSGYSVIETANPSYITTYTVSNDSNNDNTNISVGDGETVVVTIINSGLGSIIVGKLTDPYSPNVDFDFTADAPLSPISFTLQSDEEQLFEDLEPGTYSLQEVDNDDYFPEYLFSNNSTSPSAIAVAAGENVTVAVLNHLQTTFAGLYKIVRSKRQDTLVNQNQQLVDVKIPDPFIITAVIQDK